MFTITLTSPLINLKMSIFCISIIHHFAFIVSSMSLTRCFSNKRSIHLSQKVPRRPHPKPTRTYNTQENKKRRMNLLEQENHDLREEVTSLQVEIFAGGYAQLSTTSSSSQSSSSDHYAFYSGFNGVNQYSTTYHALGHTL